MSSGKMKFEKACQILSFYAINSINLIIFLVYAMQSKDVRRRELAPLQKIRDNYEKIVLSLAPGLDSTYDGIKSFNLIDWLLS